MATRLVVQAAAPEERLFASASTPEANTGQTRERYAEDYGRLRQLPAGMEKSTVAPGERVQVFGSVRLVVPEPFGVRVTDACPPERLKPVNDCDEAAFSFPLT